MADQITVEHDEAHRRYRVRLDGHLAGTSHYRIHAGTIVVYHTEVDPKYEGTGVGSALAKGVLDDLRARGEHLVPECPFVAAYIKRHPEYADLVTTA